MNDETAKWLLEVYNGLLQAGACADCIGDEPDDNGFGVLSPEDQDSLQDIKTATDLAYQITERLLQKHGIDTATDAQYSGDISQP